MSDPLTQSVKILNTTPRVIKSDLRNFTVNASFETGTLLPSYTVSRQTKWPMSTGGAIVSDTNPSIVGQLNVLYCSSFNPQSIRWVAELGENTQTISQDPEIVPFIQQITIVPVSENETQYNLTLTWTGDSSDLETWKQAKIYFTYDSFVEEIVTEGSPPPGLGPSTIALNILDTEQVGIYMFSTEVGNTTPWFTNPGPAQFLLNPENTSIITNQFTHYDSVYDLAWEMSNDNKTSWWEVANESFDDFPTSFLSTQTTILLPGDPLLNSITATQKSTSISLPYEMIFILVSMGSVSVESYFRVKATAR